MAAVVSRGIKYTFRHDSLSKRNNKCGCCVSRGIKYTFWHDSLSQRTTCMAASDSAELENIRPEKQRVRQTIKLQTAGGDSEIPFNFVIEMGWMGRVRGRGRGGAIRRVRRVGKAMTVCICSGHCRRDWGWGGGGGASPTT